jgi:hypothetical protein
MLDPKLQQAMGPSWSRAHKRSRLLSRMLVAADRPANESYQVDLEKGQIEYAIDGSTTTWGTAMLIGTHSHVNGTWMWGFNNPSVSAENSRAMHELYSLDPAIHDSAIHHAIGSDSSLLHDLCDYYSEKAGFLAAFPAEQEKVTAWLAVTPSLRPDWSTDSEGNVWCDTCGIPSINAKQIFNGALGRVCDGCINLALDALGDSATDVDRVEFPDLPPCILSGEHTVRLMTAYSAISYYAALQISQMPVFIRT